MELVGLSLIARAYFCARKCTHGLREVFLVTSRRSHGDEVWLEEEVGSNTINGVDFRNGGKEGSTGHVPVSQRVAGDFGVLIQGLLELPSSVWYWEPLPTPTPSPARFRGPEGLILCRRWERLLGKGTPQGLSTRSSSGDWFPLDWPLAEGPHCLEPKRVPPWGRCRPLGDSSGR